MCYTQFGVVKFRTAAEGHQDKRWPVEAETRTLWLPWGGSGELDWLAYLRERLPHVYKDHFMEDH